jgi:transposase-like protein
MEAIGGHKTIQEIAADHAISPIQLSQWKRQLLDGASELFTRGSSRWRILQAYPLLEPADIDDALAYAAWRMEEREEALVLS